MGNRGKRIEIEKNLRDRGDSQQKQYLKEKDIGINKLVYLRRHPDCGDTRGKKIKAISKEDRPRSSSPRWMRHNLSASQATDTSLDAIILSSKPEGLESTMDEPLDYRTRIRDHYTKLSKDFAKISLKRDLLVKEVKSGDVLKIQSSDEPLVIPEKSKVPSVTMSCDSIETPKRKPIIKTITTKKEGVRVYKAVTFMDTPQMNTLQIKMPRAPIKKGDFKSRIPKRIKTISNHQIEQNPKPKKKVAKVKPVKTLSPERAKISPLISAAKIVSPPTEVAKWSPSQDSAMPYYEAWVNTTLAAISKFSKKDRLLLEKQNIRQMFRRQLDYQPYYPELSDERYTGKIRVKQR